MELTELTALVTGANRGIGRALVEVLAREPLGLVLAGVRDPDAFAPVSDARAEVRPVALDLSSKESIAAGAAELPSVDLLVNNAGQMTGGLLEEQDVDEVYAMFQVNLVAVAHLTALLLGGMVERGRGKVVNNASISGYASFPSASTYAASKAGVVALSESLRRELKGTGVTVLHTVTPGVKTDMGDATADTYAGHMDTSNWDFVDPEEWAAKVVKAIHEDDHIVGPGGRLAIAKLASRGPAALVDLLSDRMFSRSPRS
ncbi:MAG TPA: SDR family NAD(P)-dependent oxidoreductase [Solirubrobacteraceae bacterium]